MASNTVVKSDRFSDIDENDPLAELSRIMGLDAGVRAASSDDVDFGIDLEKELLGEAELASSAPAEAADDLDLDFDAAFSDIAPAGQQAAVHVEAAVASEIPQDDDFADDFADVDLLADEVDSAFEAVEASAPASIAPSEPVAVDEPRAEAIVDAYQADMSLEDELGDLLNTDETPAGQPAAVTLDELEEDAEASDDWELGDFDLAEAEAESAIEDDVAPTPALELAIAETEPDEPVFEPAPEPVAEAVAVEPAPVFAAEEPAFEDEMDVAASDDFELDLDDFNVAAPAGEAERPIAFEAIAEELPVVDELEAAIADFENDPAWDSALDYVPADPEPRIEPVAVPHPVAPQAVSEPIRFDPIRRAEPRVVQPAASAPAPSVDDEDPFAALAALAAAPPIMKTLGRANPVAMNAASDRPQAASPANPPAGLRPVEATTPRAVPAWPFLSRSSETPAPAKPTAEAAAPRPVAPVERPVAANVNPYREPAPIASAPVTRSSEPAPRPSPPAWLSAGHAPAAPRAETVAPPRIERAPAYAPAASTAAVAATPAAADDLDLELDDLISDLDLAPDVETVEIDDTAVALADEFDIPELAHEEPVQARADLDDFESDFADAFNQLSKPASAAAAPSWRQASTLAPAAVPAGSDAYRHPADAMLDEDFSNYQRQMETDIGAFEDAGDFQVPVDEDDEPVRRPSANRLPLYGAIFAGLALLVGAGAYAWSSFGDGGSGEPALVRADAAPVKVKPENPGGTVVPNQNGKVYERVAGSSQAPAPSQEKLISSVEEPIVPAPRPEATALPGVESPQIKSEERVTPAETAEAGTSSEETAAIAPKRVRTMIVKPDGTLVEREVPAPATAEAQPTAPAAAEPEQTATVAAVTPVVVPSAVEAEEPAAAPAAQEPAAKPAVAPKPVKTTTIKPKPVDEAKPAAQQAEPTVELAGGPAAAAAPAGDFWSVQIASQPSRDGAQASYEALANRYGSVIGGKGVNIVQADVKGKPMWRVRIPAASKNDANILCAKLKTAGGSCFVSK